MEKYKIGDVSKILGISPDLLRYYEKKGVVKPTKDATNDYRYYDFWDINFLLDCIWFKNFGFSIDQISEMVRIHSTGELSALFEQKEDELQETIFRSQLLLERAEEHRGDLAKINRLLGKCELAESPEFVRYINRYTDNFDTSPALQKLSHDWLNLMPFVHRCFEIAEIDLKRGDGKDYSWGLSLSMDYVERLHVSTEPPVIHVPAHKRCIHSVFKSSGKGNFSPQLLGYMVDYAIFNDLSICGPARGILLASVLENDSLTGYFEVWLPVEE